MTKENKYRVVFFVLFAISALFFFDIFRIDLEDKAQVMPIFIYGEPAEMPIIEERLGEVDAAACSSTKQGEKVVRLAAISMLKSKTDELGGNGIIDVRTSYGKHPDLNQKCPFGVSVTGTAVIFDN